MIKAAILRTEDVDARNGKDVPARIRRRIDPRTAYPMDLNLVGPLGRESLARLRVIMGVNYIAEI